MKTLLKHLSCFCLFFIFGANYAIAQNYQHDFDQVVKKVDDLLWYEKVGDIAHIDKVYLCGPARWKEANPTGMSAGNELKFWTYIFIPTRRFQHVLRPYRPGTDRPGIHRGLR